MALKMAKSGKALEYFNLTVKNGFTVEELAYLILGWEHEYDKVKKIKSYSKLMIIAKKQLLDKGLMWLECPDEHLTYDMDDVDSVHKKVMEHIKDVEPTKYLGKTKEEIIKLQLEGA